ncbi:hypothetical protein KC366_g24 [Hortaea werneckii]|nr:hypothetical protein KC366_g24 [Hortaea werneckii]
MHATRSHKGQTLADWFCLKPQSLDFRTYFSRGSAPSSCIGVKGHQQRLASCVVAEGPNELLSCTRNCRTLRSTFSKLLRLLSEETCRTCHLSSGPMRRTRQFSLCSLGQDPSVCHGGRILADEQEGVRRQQKSAAQDAQFSGDAGISQNSYSTTPVLSSILAH